MNENGIHNLETRELDGPDGRAAAILVGVDINDLATADAFVGEVVRKVLMQRMAGPPATSMLCITVIGPMSSQTFANLWHKHIRSEPALAAFVGAMTKADVLHGTPQGQLLDQVSLLTPGPGGSGRQGGGGGLLSKARSLFGGKRK